MKKVTSLFFAVALAMASNAQCTAPNTEYIFEDDFSTWQTTPTTYFNSCYTRYVGACVQPSCYSGQGAASNTPRVVADNGKALWFTNSSSNYYNIAFLPLLTADNVDLVLEFDLAMSNSNFQMEILRSTSSQLNSLTAGEVITTITDGTAGNTDNYTNAMSHYKHYEIKIENYQAGTYIGFRGYAPYSRAAYIDNVKVRQLRDNDVAAISVTSDVENSIGANVEKADFTVRVRNFGMLTQTNIPVKLEIDGNVVATEYLHNTLSPTDTLPVSIITDNTATGNMPNYTDITFTNIDISTDTTHIFNVRAYTDLATDDLRINDTTDILQITNFIPAICGGGYDIQIGGKNYSNTSINIPVRTGSADYNYTQSIYVKDSIENAIGGTSAQINSISYYRSGTSGNLNNTDNWTVYIGHTSKDRFTSKTDWVSFDNLLQVYKGTVTLPASNSWLTIPLDIPFVWNGDSNIVVAIHENVAGSGNAINWGINNGTTNIQRTMFHNSSSVNPVSPPQLNETTTSNRAIYYPIIKFNICSESCLRPTIIEITPLDSSAIITVAESNYVAATQWQYLINTTNTMPDTNTAVLVNENPFTITNLQPSTTYYFWVRSYCSDTEQSYWVAGGSFKTACTQYSLPFEEDFTDWTATAAYFAPCWLRYTGTGAAANTPQVSTSNDKSLKLSNSSTNPYNLAFLPLLDAHNEDLVLEFDLAMGSSIRMEIVVYNYQQLGDRTAGTIITTINDGVNTNVANTKHYTIKIPDYKQGTYIAFRTYSTSTTDGYLDNIKIRRLINPDVGAIEITSSVGSTIGANLELVTFTVKVKNYGLLEQTNVPVTLEIDGVVIESIPILSLPSLISTGTTTTGVLTSSMNSPYIGLPDVTFTGISIDTTETHKFNIRAYTDLAAEQYRPNDTTAMIYITNIIPIICNGNFDAQIGDNSATPQQNVPIRSKSNYSYTQTIYLASDIPATSGTPAQINSIAYFRSGSLGDLIGTQNQWVIYMGHTSKTKFNSTTDWVTLNNLIQVYYSDNANTSKVIAPTSPPADAWITIPLDIPFVWDGESNIVVAIDENNSSLSPNNNNITWGSKLSTENCVIYYYGGSSPNPNPASPPEAATGTGSSRVEWLSKTFPSIKFNMCYLPRTVTFNAGTGTCNCANSFLRENAYGDGVTLPSAVSCANGWTFVGWSETPISATTTAPTLLFANSLYTPTGNITLYAVYQNGGTYNTKPTCATTNIFDVTEYKIVLYPNPAKHTATLVVEGLNSSAQVVVTDLMGRAVASYRLNPSETHLDINVHNLADGTYFVRIISEKATSIQKMIVKK